MLEQILPVVFALLGLSLLIFVHELGHLIAAISAGMEVEAFGIGFGRPIVAFQVRGILFRLCWIPFGGYVKIVGMNTNETVVCAPGKVSFFDAAPYQRLKVAAAGPIANILLAFVMFAAIWAMGGRSATFSSVTNRVGWVDPASELYAKGLRPGDKVLAYSGKEVRTSQDHLQAAMTAGHVLAVDFETMMTYSQHQKRISCVISPYAMPHQDQGILTTGVLAPASFVIWNPSETSPSGVMLSMPATLQGGFRPFDRILWVDNVSIFSLKQLEEVLNEEAVLLTIQRRGGEAQGPRQVRVPRVRVSDMKLTSEVRGELSDWQYMASIRNVKVSDLWFIPYNISHDGVVENPLSMLEETAQRMRYSIDTLQPGDQIIAVQGKRIHHASELLSDVQHKQAVIIVERGSSYQKGQAPFSKVFAEMESAESSFVMPYSSLAFQEMVAAVGMHDEGATLFSRKLDSTSSQLVLLRPFPLVNRATFLRHIRTAIDQVTPREQLAAEESQPYNLRYVLGLVGVSDAYFQYNQNPMDAMVAAVDDIFRTLSALVSGALSPKWMAGPVGIIDSIQYHVSVGGFRESFVWLALLSVNLAVLNLLPLPILDGGYIVLSLFEMATGIKPKIHLLEKILFPFVLLLIALFVYLTYNDIVRLILRFFG